MREADNKRYENSTFCLIKQAASLVFLTQGKTPIFTAFIVLYISALITRHSNNGWQLISVSLNSIYIYIYINFVV